MTEAIKTTATRLDSIPSLFTRCFDKITKTTKDLIGRLQIGEPIIINDQNITPIDLFSISVGDCKYDLLNIIKLNLGISNQEGDLEPAQLEIISKNFIKAKAYLREYLHINLPAQLINMQGFSSQEELLKFIRGAYALKETIQRQAGADITKKEENDFDPGSQLRRKGLSYSPFICAIIKVMLAIWEIERQEFEKLKEDSEWVYNMLFKPLTDITGKTTNKVIYFYEDRKIDEKWQSVGILAPGQENNPEIKASLSARSKDKWRTISKILRKPEADFEKLRNDGIGLRFEVQNQNDAKRLIAFLPDFLIQKFGFQFSEIENINLLDAATIEKLRNDYGLQSFLNPEKEIKTNEEIKNKTRNNKFRAFNINGKVDINGDHEEHIEVQIVLTGNENESGMSHHSIYEAVQKLSVITRLFGSISNQILDNIIDEAHRKTGFAWAKIKGYICNKDINEAYVIPIQIIGGQTKRWFAKDQITRWTKAGWGPEILLNPARKILGLDKPPANDPQGGANIKAA